MFRTVFVLVLWIASWALLIAAFVVGFGKEHTMEAKLLWTVVIIGLIIDRIAATLED